ncbi:MAG TPA: DUF151 domain-containing protein [Spirochaetia bacterium]|nr:DUF151 domain-containing protein [Spirochaetia bacterium]
MSSDMLIPAEIWTVAQTEQGNVVFVRPTDADIVVPIFIGQMETQAILIGLGKLNTSRPFTHDLIIQIFKSLHVTLDRIEICDLVDGTYYGRLKLNVNGSDHLVIVDARPSDALALAVRVMCPIYIAEHVVNEAGILIDLVNPSDKDERGSMTDFDTKGIAAADPLISELEALEIELKSAIEKEDYETAAIIRDKIKELKKRARSEDS